MTFQEFKCASSLLNVWLSVHAPQPAVVVQGQEPLTTSMLAAAPLHEQKQMLGKYSPIGRPTFTKGTM